MRKSKTNPSTKRTPQTLATVLSPAAVGGVSHPISLAEVESLLSEFGPLLPTLAPPKRDMILAGLQWMALETWRQAQQAAACGRVPAGDWRNYATVLAIVFDKVQLALGAPTAIVDTYAEHRHLFPQIAARLARVTEAVALPVAGEPGP